MEEKIKAYEEYIKEKSDAVHGPIERLKLAEYHKEMVKNFQHERLVHLIIMLFFVAVSLILIGGFIIMQCVYGFLFELIPFYMILAIVVVLTGCYIRHYYFLENHIQDLYQYTKKLRLKD